MLCIFSLAEEDVEEDQLHEIEREDEESECLLEPTERERVSITPPSRPARPPPPVNKPKLPPPPVRRPRHPIEQDGSPLEQEEADPTSSSSSQEEFTTLPPLRQADTPSPHNEDQVKPKPRVRPTRPPPVCIRTHEQPLKSVSPEPLRPQRPFPPQNSKKPVRPPLPKPRSHTYDSSCSSSSVADTHPLKPPSRPPPPYVSLYPGKGSLERAKPYQEEKGSLEKPKLYEEHSDNGSLEKVDYETYFDEAPPDISSDSSLDAEPEGQ